MEELLARVNIGCGKNPTPGWLNYDNSPSIRLAKHSFVYTIADRLGFLGDEQRSFVAFCRNSKILWADGTKRIPLPDGSVEVLYSCHMVEHLDRDSAKRFVREALRVLASDGIIRIAVPDLKRYVEEYVENGNADMLIERMKITMPKAEKHIDRLKFLLLGGRNHLWMYDGTSMAGLLAQMGFMESRVMKAGETIIADSQGLNLFERCEDSVYVEGRRRS